MYRLAYRNFGSYQALAFVHTVDADAPNGNRAGMRWYELRKTTGNWGIGNQGTFGPADGLYRWMGAAAMDQDGDLAIGYSIGNGTAPNYPGIAYAGRLATDPPDTLGQGEATLHIGTGSQTGPAFRWGDYSMMTTDPVDDCTFWYTTEYLNTTGRNPWRTRIGSFKFPSCRVAATATASSATAYRRLRLRLHRLHHRHHLRRLRHLRHLRHRHRHRLHLHHRLHLRRRLHLRHRPASATADGALPGAEGDRADAWPGEDEDPPGALLGRTHPPRSLEAGRPRDRPEPEAGRDQARAASRSSSSSAGARQRHEDRR